MSSRRRCGGFRSRSRFRCCQAQEESEWAISDPICGKLQLSAKVRYGAEGEVRKFVADGDPGACDEDGRLARGRPRAEAQISTGRDEDNNVIYQSLV